MRQTPAALTAQEIQMLSQALDVAARRGAYGAAEMAAIGQLHQRLQQLAQTNNNNDTETKNDQDQDQDYIRKE